MATDKKPWNIPIKEGIIYLLYEFLTKKKIYYGSWIEGNTFPNSFFFSSPLKFYTCFCFLFRIRKIGENKIRIQIKGPKNVDPTGTATLAYTWESKAQWCDGQLDVGTGSGQHDPVTQHLGDLPVNPPPPLLHLNDIFSLTGESNAFVEYVAFSKQPDIRLKIIFSILPLPNPLFDRSTSVSGIKLAHITGQFDIRFIPSR